MNWFKRLTHTHKWIYNNPVVVDHVLKIYKVTPKRFCTVCGRYEHKDEHLLGMHPPEYVVSWLKLQGKPKLKFINGSWRL